MIIQKSKINEIAKKCLTERLYSPAQDYMRSLYKNPEYINDIAVYEKDEKIVGAAILCDNEYNLLVFVKPKYRKQGIGRLLIEEIKTINKGPYNVSKVDSNRKFWEKICI